MSSVLKDFVLGPDQTAIEYLLVTSLHVPPDKAKLYTAVFQLVMFALLVVVTIVFLQWRFGAFEEKGCSAFCNCVARMGNISYQM